MTTSHPLTPRAQRAFARTEKAVAAAREDFAAAQSALQKALARGVDVEATLSQATDVLADVPGTPLPKTLGPEEAAVERVYDRLGELLDTCKEYDAIHHELEVDTCLADAATNIQGDLRRLHAQWERCGDALKSLESCLPSPPRGTPAAPWYIRAAKQRRAVRRPVQQAESKMAELLGPRVYVRFYLRFSRGKR